MKRRTVLGLTALIALLVLAVAPVGAEEDIHFPVETAANSIHPLFEFLDADGVNVLESGNPVSTLATCGVCHDVAFITEHNFHATLGLESLTAPGGSPSGRDWDISPGWFGEWNPITYSYLSPVGDDVVNMTTPEWIMELGYRHSGGGPAVDSRDGLPLVSLEAGASNPETSYHDPETGELVAWDWSASGTVESNCFLCHMDSPDQEARMAELAAGSFEWANTATLAVTGIVSGEQGSWVWNPSAFDENGELKREYVTITDPTNENCAACHGEVHEGDEPFNSVGSVSAGWETLTTGQVFSGQRISDSALNIENKDELTRAWDAHAEREVGCVDCHHSLTNPIYLETARPSYLDVEARRADFNDYLLRPLHEFAKGRSAQGALAPEYDYTMRSCESCHNIEAAHDWLPYTERHMSQLACETCHIPQMYEPAAEAYDWTVLLSDGSPKVTYRGIEGDLGDPTALITGYRPVILKREGAEGEVKLAPYNLISSWFWVYGDPARPVPAGVLEEAFLVDGGYRPDIVAIFDTNGNGILTEPELYIETEEQEIAIKNILRSLGMDNPRIEAEIQPYTVAHGVAGEGYATQSCESCHSSDSRMVAGMELNGYLPGGVMPEFVLDTNTETAGIAEVRDDGSIWYQPTTAEQGVAVLGNQAGYWIDWVGWAAFVGTILVIGFHGGLRWFFTRKLRKAKPEELEMVYMYEPYERLWHWLQAIVIISLIVTGVYIHYPNLSEAAGAFKASVLIHNVLAVILVANAVLAILWHISSGLIREYIPRPRGFFDQALTQGMYYARGIFRGEPHPFEKKQGQKLNPLQMMTYIGILNVLLPLQILTGIVIWGAERFPTITTALGGLPFILPLHTLVAWLFATFVVLHMYLTTTGSTPLAAIRAMISGWEAMEPHSHEEVTA